MQKRILFMYKEQNLIYIFTMLECIEKCWIYSKEFKSGHEFVWANDQKELNAVISLFIAIGEESKKTEKSLKDDIEADINWSDVAGIRDKISHDYRGVDEKILWNTIQQELYFLKDALVDMIKLINPSNELLEEFLSSPYYRHLGYLYDIGDFRVDSLFFDVEISGEDIDENLIVEWSSYDSFDQNNFEELYHLLQPFCMSGDWQNMIDSQIKDGREFSYHIVDMWFFSKSGAKIDMQEISKREFPISVEIQDLLSDMRK
jgi:uncharacterized protein with HEPN domain